MTDHELDRLVAASAPITDEQVASLPLAGSEADLCEAIMSTPTIESIPDTKQEGARRWSRRRRLALLGTAAAVVAAVVLVVQPLGRQTTSAWAAEVLEVAESAPRLLVTEPGWTVTRADEFSIELGEMAFSNGQRELDLHWRAASEHDDFVQDRAASADSPSTITVAGHQAVLFQYTGTTDFTTLWLDGDHSVELRGRFPTIDDYLAVIGTLERVSIDDWLTAMPASTVRPDSRAAAVEDMLTDIPLPTGLDVEALKDSGSVSDRYQLGAQVTGTVACAWIEQWLAATETGDTAAAQEAVNAMNTSRNWAILLEMDSDGYYPEMVWLHADALSDGGTSSQEGFTVDGYVEALGCNDR